MGPQRIETPDGLGLDGSARALALKGDQVGGPLWASRSASRRRYRGQRGNVFSVKRIGIELLRRVEVDFPQEAGMPCGDKAFELLGARDLAALQERDRGGLDGFVGADETGRAPLTTDMELDRAGAISPSRPSTLGHSSGTNAHSKSGSIRSSSNGPPTVLGLRLNLGKYEKRTATAHGSARRFRD